jgi:hypothetical protein
MSVLDSLHSAKPEKFWTSRDNRLLFVMHLEDRLSILLHNFTKLKIADRNDIKRIDDWYSVSVQEVRENGGKEWMKWFKGSLMRALQDVYPEHNWPVRDQNTHQRPSNDWQNFDNQVKFVKNLEKSLSIAQFVV